ncbi:TnsA-like heteromeric transposase endonuclease subunit [Micromonospora sp. NPDC047548]|uniref:TnsA-like heteromeric transposase endonuclease subunit n=1 Tax=Micromonospora sp. NPDC047548 TaxID=3155624 RepID=UPI003406BEAB
MGGGVAVAGWDEIGVELEFAAADGGVRRRPLAQCLNVRFEEVAPARSFPSYRGQRNFPGWWWSSTMGRHVGYESWLERDHVMLLDFDVQVTAFASQPFWLHWPAAGRARRHLPDYFARQVDGVGVVIDVRAEDRIEPADAEAFAATAAACEAAGWQFRRVGTLDGVFAANVRWLSRYRHPRCGRREDLIVRLLEVFAQPTPLFAGAERVGDRLLVLPVLYHLLWRQVLIVDLRSALLGPSTLVRQGQRRGS